ncbi:MAG: hypothetical protein ACD_9C00319G0001, partial [uncultured bacterium]
DGAFFFMGNYLLIMKFVEIMFVVFIAIATSNFHG